MRSRPTCACSRRGPVRCHRSSESRALLSCRVKGRAAEAPFRWATRDEQHAFRLACVGYRRDLRIHPGRGHDAKSHITNASRGMGGRRRRLDATVRQWVAILDSFIFRSRGSSIYLSEERAPGDTHEPSLVQKWRARQLPICRHRDAGNHVSGEQRRFLLG